MTEEEPMHRLNAAVAATLTATAMTACGAQDEGADERAVKKVAEAFLRATGNGDGDAACRQLTTNAQHRIAEVTHDGDCPEFIAWLHKMMSPEEARALARVRVRRARVRGDRAEIRAEDLELPDEASPAETIAIKPTTLRRVDGTWKLEAERE